MKFVATRYEGNDAYGVEFEAESIQAAMQHCKENGLTYDGMLHMAVPADFLSTEEANELCRRLASGRFD